MTSCVAGVEPRLPCGPLLPQEAPQKEESKTTKKDQGPSPEEEVHHAHLPSTACHQKQHYVPYYLSNLFFSSLKNAFGIISMFFTLVRWIIILSRFRFLTWCPNFSNFRTSSHVPWEMFHMASLVYYKIWDFLFFSYCTVFSSSLQCSTPNVRNVTAVFCFFLILFVLTVWTSIYIFKFLIFLSYHTNSKIIVLFRLWMFVMS